jgi:hypothetical protein
VKAVAIEISSMDVGSLVAVEGTPSKLFLLSITRKTESAMSRLTNIGRFAFRIPSGTGGMTDGMESAMSTLTNIGRFAFRIPSRLVV